MKHSKKYYISLFAGVLMSSLTINAQVKTLDDYMGIALTNSPTLKEDYAKIEQSKIDSSITGSAYKPQLNFTGQALTAPSYGQFGYDKAITNGGNYEAIVSATQVITPRKEIKLNRIISSNERQSLVNEAKKTENEIRKDVAEKYLNACLLQQQLEFYTASDKVLVNERNTLKTLTDKGIYRMSDYYQFAVEEQSERTLVIQLNTQLTQSFSQLNEVCGVVDTSIYKLTVPSISIYRQNDMKQLSWYVKFQYDSLQLANKQALLDATYYPHLSWYADAGIEASQPNLIYRSIGNSLGLNLAFPLYDGHKKELKHKSLAISENVRSNYEQFYTKTYSTHTVLLLKQIQDADKLIIQLKEEEQQVQEWMRVDKAQLAVGNISITDFLIGLKKELEVKNDMAQAIINQQLLQNEFNYWNH